MGVEDASVGCGGGGGSVGVAGDFPAPAVDDDDVMESAEKCQVPQGGGAALSPGDQVVDLADGGGLLAAREPAVLVPLDDGFAQVRGTTRVVRARSSGWDKLVNRAGSRWRRR